MWGATMWGSWWIFPLIAFIFMIAMFFACSGLFRGRGGLCSMRRYDDTEDLKREIAGLQEEIVKLKKSS
jgi:hypothetical protein